MLHAASFRVTGRVQGVGFRAFVVASAEARGVAGWVRNTGDGAVEGEAEGEATALDAFLADCRRGPRFGRVDAVQVRRSERSEPAFRGFVVRW